MIDPAILQFEFDGDYKPVLNELRKLERDFPQVHTNQERVVDDEVAIAINTTASLLYSSQDPDADIERTPREIREAILTLLDINGFRCMMTELVTKSFPQCIIVIERMYFQNRAAFKYFSLPETERPRGLRKIVEREWIYPEHRIDRLRTLARKIWRQNVLAAST